MKLFKSRRYPRWYYEHPGRLGLMMFAAWAAMGYGIIFLRHRPIDVGPVLGAALFGLFWFAYMSSLENPY